MYCPHCESEESQEEYKGGSITSCVNCGALISVDAYTSACKCEHCNSYLLFEERLEGEYEPHLILPFKLGREEVKEKLKKEFGSRAFTPASFSEEANLNKIEGLYVPFFLFDYHVDYQYSGIGTKVRTWVSGNTEYTETSRYDIHRELEIEFDKVPVDASIKMDDKTMDFMEPYNYKALEAFQKKYLSGFLGEMYNEQASHFENRAVDKIKSDSEIGRAHV